MAEKRGQYLYNDDGTVSMLVAIAGPGGELEGSLAMLPMDKQAQGKKQIESNTTPLGISATYTGVGFDTMANGENFNWLTGLVRADQTGTLNIQQSDDGVNWYATDSLAIGANTNVKIMLDIILRHVRFNYVNGATAQTSFKLSAYVTFK